MHANLLCDPLTYDYRLIVDSVERFPLLLCHSAHETNRRVIKRGRLRPHDLPHVLFFLHWDHGLPPSSFGIGEVISPDLAQSLAEGGVQVNNYPCVHVDLPLHVSLDLISGYGQQQGKPVQQPGLDLVKPADPRRVLLQVNSSIQKTAQLHKGVGPLAVHHLEMADSLPVPSQRLVGAKNQDEAQHNGIHLHRPRMPQLRPMDCTVCLFEELRQNFETTHDACGQQPVCGRSENDRTSKPENEGPVQLLVVVLNHPVLHPAESPLRICDV
mmetsp:Transcript_47429/g.125549  ORF Transcript_47429/g.125549 Transcript_47429/m.125549 type:complete len:270 (+) Transcript_47429:184-993(+)